MMEDFVMLFLYGIVAFWAGWHFRGIMAEIRVRKFAHDMQENLRENLEEIKKVTVKIKIEKHDEGFFVYDLEDHSYMAHGKDRKELESNLSKRYPGKFFAAEESNLKEVGFAHESI
jgi:hypothetical protein